MGRALPIVIDSVTMAALGKEARERRFHWCRYENAYGQTWETRNPVDPAAKMTIHRVRVPGVRERHEDRDVKGLRSKGLALDEQLREELLAAMGSDEPEEVQP